MKASAICHCLVKSVWIAIFVFLNNDTKELYWSHNKKRIQPITKFIESYHNKDRILVILLPFFLLRGVTFGKAFTLNIFLNFTIAARNIEYKKIQIVKAYTICSTWFVWILELVWILCEASYLSKMFSESI